MSLLKTFVSLLQLWRPAFCKEEAFERAVEHAIACLTALGRHTITSLAIWLGRGHVRPSADYRLYSVCKWRVEDIFDPLFKTAMDLVKDDYICVGADDTALHKTGSMIPQAQWGRDAMGPPFQTNLIWCLKFLQFSVLMPLYDQGIAPCRAIPIRFVDAHSVKRPGKKGSETQWQEYKVMKKKRNLSKLFVNSAREIRESMDKLGHAHKTLLFVGDGSFCNGTCMNLNIPRTHLVARCRKDAKLCYPAAEGERRVYDSKKFTPEDVGRDESIPWQTGNFYYGGQWREVRYKVRTNVLWQSATKTKRLRLIVIAPTPYFKGSHRYYRAPSYLLTTDVEGAVAKQIQAYFNRLQIEYNHRDEKSILGVGEAQVRNEWSVARQPALCVAAYSALLLSSIITYDDRHHDDFGPVPAWRKLPKRNTCRALVGLLRATLLKDPSLMVDLPLTKAALAAIFRQVA